MSDELQFALERYLSSQAGRPISVSNLTRISDGWESDVYSFDAPLWRDGSYVLRLYFGANASPTALHEYRSLDLLARAKYPVPQVALVEPSAQAVGRSFMIMERIDGVSLGKILREADSVAAEREITRFCKLLAQLHTLEWRHLAGAEHVPALFIEDQFAFWNSLISQPPVEAVRRAMAWLQNARTRVTPLPLGVVHWDFHHENILIDQNDRAWVIDWTQFQATDTRFDFAWTFVLLASERSAELAQAVRANYLAQRGWEESEVAEDLRFFEAAACAKRLLSVLIALNQGADSLGMRPGAETIMSANLSRFTIVYRQWLALTEVQLPEVESMLAAHL